MTPLFVKGGNTEDCLQGNEAVYDQTFWLLLYRFPSVSDDSGFLKSDHFVIERMKILSWLCEEKFSLKLLIGASWLAQNASHHGKGWSKTGC